nr:MAG TPA: ATP synthase [Caudoviricetes sp.]
MVLPLIPSRLLILVLSMFVRVFIRYQLGIS